MSLCVNKKDLQTLNSRINFIESLEKSVSDNSGDFIKKPVDALCSLDKECSTGFCGVPENCELVFENSNMCQSVKVCRTTNNISQPTNFNLKHN